MPTLLTGVGYIGACLVRRLLERGERVVALDNFYSTSRPQIEAALPAGCQLVEGDVAEPADMGRAFDTLGSWAGDSAASDVVVYHLAAQPSAGMAAREPTVTERSNLTGARVVLEAARARGARVVFGGSFRVYGDDLLGQRVDEGTPYGRVGDLSHLSKIYVEQLARMLGIPFVSVRLGVTYGLSPIMKTTPAFMTVPNLFCQRAAQALPLRVLEDRPMAFIHVQDAADALLQAAQQAMPGVYNAVNAAPEVATIGQVARTVQRLARAHGQSPVCITGAAGESGQGAATGADGADIGDASPDQPAGRFWVTSRLAFEPKHTLADGLGDVLDYFVARP